MASKQDVFEVLTILAAAYPRFVLAKETIHAYQMLLQDLDADELRAAAKDVATKRDFFPSVHELRGSVVEMRRRANRVPTAYEAWGQVLNAGTGTKKSVKEVEGGWAIVHEDFVFSHPLVEHVARLMGWPGSFPSVNNEMADRAHFVKAYERAMIDAMDDEITLPEVREFIEARQQQQLEDGDD